MKGIKLFSTAICSLLLGFSANAQPFSVTEDLDINQIKLAHMVHGNMWYDIGTYNPACEYPKGTGKHASYAAGLWISAMGPSGEIRTATTLYTTLGYDFMPGPLDAADTISLPSSTNWARIWKVDAPTISSFKSLFLTGGPSAITATKFDVIKEWPATGNVHAKGNAGAALPELLVAGLAAQDYAPFVDVNGDGKYNWQDGDYPKIKGDQMLWWVINDNGKFHTMSKSAALKLEIQIAAYAYNRGTGVDRMIFYEYKVNNKSDDDYTNFRLGLFTDTDLGSPVDDAIGVDSAYRMGLTFQLGKDGPNGKNSYGNNSPIAGLRLLEMPGDICSGTKQPIGSFTYFFDGSAGGAYRDPRVAKEFYNYMNARNADSLPVDGYLGSVFASFFVMKSDTCDASLYPGPSNRRYILSSAGYNFPKNSSAKWVFNFLVTDTNNHICPNIRYNEMKALADTAEQIYCNPLPTSIRNVSLAEASFKLYPNPALNTLFVQTLGKANKAESIKVIDALGKTIQLPIVRQNNQYEINTSSLASGLYSVVYFDGEQTSAQHFVKE